MFSLSLSLSLFAPLSLSSSFLFSFDRDDVCIPNIIADGVHKVLGTRGDELEEFWSICV